MLKSGQALVVVLLILGVAVTVGLSVISRSRTEVSVSTAEEESAKALEAAEAGVESALGGLVAVDAPAITGSPGSTSESTYNVVNTAVGGTTNAYELPYPLGAGEAATINMEGYGGALGDDVRICFGGATTAIEVMVYYTDGSGNVAVGRQGWGSGITGFGPVTNSGISNDCSTGTDFSHRIDFRVNPDLGVTSGTLRLMRIRLFRNGTSSPLAIRTGAPLPSQGSEIISTGQSGGSTQKLRVVQADEDLPMMFDAAIFSGGGLVQ